MNMENTHHIDIGSLVNDLEKKDSKYKKLMRRFQILFFILIFFYAGLFLVNPDPEITMNDRIAGICYVIAFILFTIQFRSLYKKYNEVNYFDPVKKVLEDAEKRYRLWHKNTFLILFAVLLIDAASILVLYNRFIDKWPFWNFFWVIQGVYLLVFALGFIIGYFRWKRDSRSIWISAKKLLKELEE